MDDMVLLQKISKVTMYSLEFTGLFQPYHWQSHNVKTSGVDDILLLQMISEVTMYSLSFLSISAVPLANSQCQDKRCG